MKSERGSVSPRMRLVVNLCSCARENALGRCLVTRKLLCVPPVPRASRFLWHFGFLRSGIRRSRRMGCHFLTSLLCLFAACNGLRSPACLLLCPAPNSSLSLTHCRLVDYPHPRSVHLLSHKRTHTHKRTQVSPGPQARAVACTSHANHPLHIGVRTTPKLREHPIPPSLPSAQSLTCSSETRRQ